MSACAPAPARRSAWSWAAVGVTASFIAVTCWWLAQDKGVPFGDAASYLLQVIHAHRVIGEANVAGALSTNGIYPPLTILVAGAATFAGGVDVSAPVVGENLIYVPLLALACYQLGRRVAGPQAGFLAVAFALGSPLLIEQFHVIMLDAPEAVLVAVSVWLLLSTERFARTGTAALAGVAVGLGLESKEQFPTFVFGLVLVMLLRGGWRNWRGLLACAACALAVGAPWYVVHFPDLHRFAELGIHPPNTPAPARPQIFSLENASWYAWAIANSLLFAPLCAIAAIGVATTVRALVRARRGAPAAGGLADVGWELLAGLAGGWLALSLNPHHDIRYTMPLLIYLAVLGTWWIAALPRAPRTLATAALLLAVLATTLGASFGVGREVRIALWRHPLRTDSFFGIPRRDRIVVYSDHDFDLSGPRAHDRIPALFAALRRAGVTGVAWNEGSAQLGDPVFETQGLEALARIAGLDAPEVGFTVMVAGRPRARLAAGVRQWNVADPRHAFLIRAAALAGPPCVRLRDGTGVWVGLGDPEPQPQLWCPWQVAPA